MSLIWDSETYMRGDAVGLAELLDLAVDEELGLAQGVVDDLDLVELVAAATSPSPWP